MPAPPDAQPAAVIGLTSAAEGSERVPAKVLHIALLLSMGHLASDFYSAFATSQLDRLRDYFHISVSAAASLPVPMIILGSLVQPFFGMLGDTVGRRRLQTAVGLTLSAVFVSCIVLSKTAPQALVLLGLGGVGVAWFHPNAAVLAGRIMPKRPGFILSMFLGGGVLGLALSPFVARYWYTFGNWSSALLVMVPGLLVAAGFLLLAPEDGGVGTKRRFFEGFRAFRGPLLGVFAFATLRALAFTGAMHFMSLYGSDQDWSNLQKTVAIVLLCLSSAAGNFLGMFLSDRFSSRSVLLYSCLFSGILLWVSYLFPYGWFLAGICSAGVAANVGMPVTVILAQKAAPDSASFGSGLVMGAAWGLSGLFMPVLAIIAKYSSMSLALQLTGPTMLASGILIMIVLPVVGRGPRKAQHAA